VAAASEARRSSGLSASGKRVSLEAEMANDSHRSSGLSTSGKRSSLEAETAYDSHRSSSLSTSSKRVSLEAETAFDSHRSSSLSTSGTDQEDSSRYYINDPGAFIKKKTKFSSYVRKSRRRTLHGHWSYMTNSLLKYLRTSSYLREQFLIYDFATAHI
jgi:hypothetical protein